MFNVLEFFFKQIRIRYVKAVNFWLFSKNFALFLFFNMLGKFFPPLPQLNQGFIGLLVVRRVRQMQK